MTAFEKDFGAFLRGHGIKNFVARELCPEGRRSGRATLKAPPCELWPNIIPTLLVLEWLREKVGRPVIVNSGYRDPFYNREVGSTDGSQHPRFTATDIRVPAIEPATIADVLETHPDAATFGIGRYPSFVHIDTRGVRARW